ncbi:cytochrome P450 reductase 1, partial [Aureobasidium melanogenum]
MSSETSRPKLHTKPYDAISTETLHRSLSGQVVIITGAAGGCGRGQCLAFANAGAKLALIDIPRASQGLEAIAAECATMTSAVKTYHCDVIDTKESAITLAQIEEDLGPVDILLNNAGGTLDRPFHMETFDQFWSMIDLNFKAPMLWTHMLFDSFRRRKQGKVINIASRSATVNGIFCANYGAAKSALVRAVGCLQAELEMDGLSDVQVYALHPGGTRSGIQKPVAEDVAEAYPQAAKAYETFCSMLKCDPSLCGQTYPQSLIHLHLSATTTWYFASPLALLLIIICYFMPGQKARSETGSTGGGILELSATADERNINGRIESEQLEAVILFGSQTGTAESYARRFAQELQRHFGLKTMVADLEDYDYGSLSVAAQHITARGTKVLFSFFLATYGEGEPCDNAAKFWDFINDESPDFDSPSKNELPLDSLRYTAFGFGNSTYEKYNEQVRRVDEHLCRLGASRIGTIGEADDNRGTTDEDYLDWKLSALVQISTALHVEKLEHKIKASMEVQELQAQEQKSQPQQLASVTANPVRGKYSPYYASINRTRHLFAPTSKRHCVHLEFDISDSGLTYETGDHLGVWPVNPETEVKRVLRLLGLQQSAERLIRVLPGDAETSSKHPHMKNPATYAELLRYHLDICGPVSRDDLKVLAKLAPSQACRELLETLAGNRNEYRDVVTTRGLNLCQLMDEVAGGIPWPEMTFALLLDLMSPLEPRYYSISSSNLTHPKAIHITTAVKREVSTQNSIFCGLASNYLKALTDAHLGAQPIVDYQLQMSSTQSATVRTPIFVRKSSFDLPSDPQVPIIMIGPGTGVAPFRAFVQERSKLVKSVQVGTSILFTGLFKAFSRDGPEKTYVQHLLRQNAELVKKLLLDQRGSLYICGDVQMAKDCIVVLNDLAGSFTTEPLATLLERQGRLHQDVW